MAKGLAEPIVVLGLESFLRVLDCLCQEISEAETSIRRSVADDSRARLLTTIPGIGFQIALIVLAEIGDVGRFPDANHLVSYAGLAPRVRSSGGKTKLGSITKQGSSALRWASSTAWLAAAVFVDCLGDACAAR